MGKEGVSMREILFRGKRLDGGAWVTGYYLELGPEFQKRSYIVPFDANGMYTFEVNKDTVGQFTGKVDKCGERIFEGDIVRVIERNVVMDGGFVTFNKERGEWTVQGIDGSSCNLARRTDIQVICSIYDVGEILKGVDHVSD